MLEAHNYLLNSALYTLTGICPNTRDKLSGFLVGIGSYMNTLNFHTAHFIQSAPSLKECPSETGAEVAFAGRSNAGKSSAINKLTGNRKLARTSKTPGRTQLINFFALNADASLRLTDLPGYGFAKVPLSTKRAWQANLTEYLYERRSLRGVVILMDIRHPLQTFDLNMLDWTAQVNMPTHILLTKADKLKRGPAKSSLLSVTKEIKKRELGDWVSAQTFSAQTAEGMDELQETLSAWLLGEQKQTIKNDSSDD